jgi:hypothetical protein
MSTSSNTSSNSESSESSGPLLISQPKLFNNFLASFLKTIRLFFPIEGPGGLSPILDTIYIDLADRRHITMYVSQNGQMNAVSYHMPVPHNFPIPALFPGMVLEKNFPAILPTKEVVFTIPAPNAQAVPWQNEIIRVAGVAADATIPKARRKAAANLLAYWKTMHTFMMKRLDRADINLNRYWTTMPQHTKDILGYIQPSPSSSSRNVVPPVRGILATPRPIHRRSQTRSDTQRRNRRSNARRTRSANARVVYRRVSEMDPRSTHSNADPVDPGHIFPPRVPTYKRGPLDPI